jgi:hypothetical protein
MQQCTLSLEDGFYQQLKRHADERGVSLSHVMRELMELGWQVKQATGNSQSDATPDYIEPLLMWQLETRYLVRYMLGHMLDNNEAASVIRDLKGKADSYVKGLLGEEAESVTNV